MLDWSGVYAKSGESEPVRGQWSTSGIVAGQEIEAMEIGKLSEQRHRDDVQPSVGVPHVHRIPPRCGQSDDADEQTKPWSFSKEDRDIVHLILRLYQDAAEQMISSAGEESTAGKGDGLERAGVVASLVDNGIEYFDRDDMVIGRHRLDRAREG